MGALEEVAALIISRNFFLHSRLNFCAKVSLEEREISKSLSLGVFSIP